MMSNLVSSWVLESNNSANNPDTGKTIILTLFLMYPSYTGRSIKMENEVLQNAFRTVIFTKYLKT